jgi:hypothetical protein
MSLGTDRDDVSVGSHIPRRVAAEALHTKSGSSGLFCRHCGEAGRLCAIIAVRECSRSHAARCARSGSGSLAEWSIAPVLKTGNPQGFQGSNP